MPVVRSDYFRIFHDITYNYKVECCYYVWNKPGFLVSAPARWTLFFKVKNGPSYRIDGNTSAHGNENDEKIYFNNI